MIQKVFMVFWLEIIFVSANFTLHMKKNVQHSGVLAQKDTTICMLCVCVCVSLFPWSVLFHTCVSAGSISVVTRLKAPVLAGLSIGRVDLWVLKDPGTEIRLCCWSILTSATQALNWSSRHHWHKWWEEEGEAWNCVSRLLQVQKQPIKLYARDCCFGIPWYLNHIVGILILRSEVNSNNNCIFVSQSRIKASFVCCSKRAFFVLLIGNLWTTTLSMSWLVILLPPQAK